MQIAILFLPPGTTLHKLRESLLPQFHFDFLDFKSLSYEVQSKKSFISFDLEPKIWQYFSEEELKKMKFINNYSSYLVQFTEFTLFKKCIEQICKTFTLYVYNDNDLIYDCSTFKDLISPSDFYRYSNNGDDSES